MLTPPEREARDVLRKFCDDCGSQRQAAKRLGVSAQYVSDLLNGMRVVPDRILRKLGFRYDVTLVRIAS